MIQCHKGREVYEEAEHRKKSGRALSVQAARYHASHMYPLHGCSENSCKICASFGKTVYLACKNQSRGYILIDRNRMP